MTYVTGISALFNDVHRFLYTPEMLSSMKSQSVAQEVLRRSFFGDADWLSRSQWRLQKTFLLPLGAFVKSWERNTTIQDSKV